MRGEFAKLYCTGFLQSGHGGSVPNGNVVDADARMTRRQDVFGVVDIFQADRDAVKGTPIPAFRNLALGMPRLLHRMVLCQRDERCERAVEISDARKMRLRKLNRGDLARSHKARSFRDGKKMEVTHEEASLSGLQCATQPQVYPIN